MKRIVTTISIVSLFVIPSLTNAQITPNEEHNTGIAKIKSLSMPLSFIENRGQFNDKTLFKAKIGGAAFYFSNDEVAYLFVRDTNELIEDGDSGFDEIRRPEYKKESLLIKAQFVGANPDPEVVGLDRLSRKSNYFYGNDPSNWRTNVPEYSAIIYMDIYPGIDLKYYGDGHSMKYDFIVAAGADVSMIRIGYDGIDDMAISENGDLKLTTSFGPIYENAQYAYQEIGGERREVTAKYKLYDYDQFGFDVTGYNPAYPLVIDPELVYSTYLGGIDEDRGRGIAVDNSGYIYVVGHTASYDFPVQNPFQSIKNGYWDVFVTKFTPDGSALAFSTYIGGSSTEQADGIAIDNDNNIYVTGITGSTDFPTVNPYQTYQAGWDLFILKLNSDGDSLIYSTYLGGSDNDGEFSYVRNNIAVDDSGSAYVTGFTLSADFPTLNPYQNDQPGADVFVTKFSPEGNSLIYSTYLGGSGYEWCYTIAVDIFRNAYITGRTNSTDFPVANPYQTDQPNKDVFVSKLSASGDSLVYSTYLGGHWNETGLGIAVNDSGYAYIAGVTESDDFPTENAFQPEMFPGYGPDAFITKMSQGGDSLIYSTFLGGKYSDVCYDITLDTERNIYVAGYTGANGFPIFNAIPIDQHQEGAFVAKFAPWGNSIIYSTIMSGSEYERALSIAADDDGYTYVTGYTNSPDFPVVNQFQTYQGEYDAFVSKLDTASSPVTYCTNCFGGVIYNIEYNPIESVYVEVLNTGIFDYTNSAGGYSLENLVPGTYDVSVSHPDYQDSTISDVIIIDNQFTGLNIYLFTNSAIRGVVTDTNSVPIENAYVRVLYFNDLLDYTDSLGNYLISGLPPDSMFEIRFHRHLYFDQYISDVTVGINETLQMDTVYLVPNPEAINIWFGNLDGSPVETLVGDTFYVDVYMQNLGQGHLVGYMHVPLGTDDLYVVDHLSRTLGQWYYPLTAWDFVEFLAPNAMDSGWTNQSFQAFCNGGVPDPPFYSETPAKVCTFALKAVNDSSLLGDTVDCFIEGYHPANEGLLIGLVDGVTILEPFLFFSPLAFVELLSCHYTTGDVNNSGDYDGLDITYGVNFLKGGDPPLYECECTLGNTWYVSGDVNGSCSYNGLDITYGVSYFKGGPDPIPCPDCPPVE